MTKKHFVAFADYIKHSEATEYAKRAMANMVIAIARSDNGRFDTDRFLRACGLEN